MSTHRPSLFRSNDAVEIRLTAPDGYRIPFTFVEALNEGVLFDRSARVFAEAARKQGLYEVVVGDDERIIGTAMFQDTFTDADGDHHEEELGGLMVHPGTRGFGVMTVLLKVMMVHRYAIMIPHDTLEEDIAHVVDGNQGPVHGLVAAGFEPIGEVKLHPGEFDGAMGHMMFPGEDFVRFHAYRFNGAAIGRLIHDLWNLCDQGGRLRGKDTSVNVGVDFSSIVSTDFLSSAVTTAR